MTVQTQRFLAAIAVESIASGAFLPAAKDDDSHFVGSWEEVYMVLIPLQSSLWGATKSIMFLAEKEHEEVTTLATFRVFLVEKIFFFVDEGTTAVKSEILLLS